MSLTINQTQALIGIDRTPGKLEMQSKPARLEYEFKRVKVNIDTEQPRIEIDQYEAFASAGLKNMYDLAKEAAQAGYDSVMEYIGKTASDGRMLAAIEKGGNPLSEIAKRDAYPEKTFGYGWIPKVGPKFNVTGSIKFDPEPAYLGALNGVEGSYIPGEVNYNFTPAQINIFMRQYNSISFSYQGNNVDIYT